MPCRVSLVVALVACAAVVALCAAPSLAAVPSAPTSALSSTSAAEYQSTAEPLERAADVSSPFLPLFPLDSLVVTRLWSALQSLSSGASSSASSVLLPHPAVPVASHPLSSLRPAASTVHSLDYTIPASAPPYLPAARLTCALQVVDGGSHRSVLLQLGSPAQSLRLLVDTGSSDLVALNASYCIRSPSASRNCFNPSAPASPQSATVVSSAPFALPAYVDDGEVLSDSSAHAALALANLPVQLLGANLSLLLGAADLTMQDALLGYPTAASRQVSFVLSNPQTVFVPPIPAVNFPYSVSAVNSLLDVDGLLGLSYASLSALAQLDANTYSSAFLAITQATQTQAESTTFALDFSKNIAYIGGIDGHSPAHSALAYRGTIGMRRQITLSEHIRTPYLSLSHGRTVGLCCAALCCVRRFIWFVCVCVCVRELSLLSPVGLRCSGWIGRLPQLLHVGFQRVWRQLAAGSVAGRRTSVCHC